MTELVLVYVTCPEGPVALRIACALVKERLAACGNIVPGLRSVYVWQGEVHDDTEVLLLLKTRADRVDDLTARVQALHPYELPEVVAVPINAGSPAYLDWVRAGVDPAVPGLEPESEPEPDPDPPDVRSPSTSESPGR